MRKTKIFRKYLPLVYLVFMFAAYAFPLASLAAGAGEGREPLEKVICKSGEWNTEYVEIDGRTRLIVEYRGKYKIEQAPSDKLRPVSFKLREKTILEGIYLPYGYPAEGSADIAGLSVTFKDEKGNLYGPFNTIPFSIPTVRNSVMERTASDAPLDGVSKYIFKDNAFIPLPEEEIVLPPGTYTVSVDPSQGVVSRGGAWAILVKGVNYAAYKKYEEEMLELGEESLNFGDNEGGETAVSVESTEFGEGELAVFVNMDDDRDVPAPLTQSKPGNVSPKPAKIFLEDRAQIDQIIFNTYNGGKGAVPGQIAIIDKSGKTVAVCRASGGSLGGVPNGLWVASPGFVLEPGEYTLRLSDPSAAGFDKDGNPDFYVKAVLAKPKPYNFTGRYIINADVVKVSTLAGPADGNQSPFSLKDFELGVLDRGESIELVGRYENMPFSQLCTVTKREENRVEGTFQFSMDLKGLPYKAKVGAVVNVILEKPPGLQPRIAVSGNGTYERTSQKYGNDFNTYKITGGGNMLSEELPAFVAAALGKRTGSAGNIPGPASPFQAAAGMLFPPLAGLVAHIIQGLAKPKEEKQPKLSVGEQAMADANKSLGKGLYDEEEAKAWAVMAEALANSDEPDDDPYAVGDNEKADGKKEAQTEWDADEWQDEPAAGSGEYHEEAAGESGESSPEMPPETVFAGEKEKLEAERDEWLKNLEESIKSADPNDPRAGELHKQYQEYIDYLNSRISELSQKPQQVMTVQVDHTGRTAEIAFDEKTGQWYNTESKNIFDMDRYVRDVMPSFAKDAAFIAGERSKLESRGTAFDKEMDAFVEDSKRRAALLGQIQNIRNQAYGIEPPAPGVGDVQSNIRDLIKDLSNTEIPLKDLEQRAKNIAKVVIDRNTGRTMSEEAAKSLAGSWSDMSVLANTAVDSATDVLTGRTWAGMAGRAGLAVLTGGASEYVMSPAEALISIKESMDQGESGIRATIKAMGEYALGELGGEYLGAAWKKSGLSINPDFAEKMVKLGNTPVSEILGGGGKGARAGIENVFSSKGKLGTGNLADDLAEYSGYRAGVKNQASMIEGKIRAGQELTPDEIRKALRDPGVARELKNSHPDIQNAYQDALDNTLYNPAKSNASARLEQDLAPEIKKQFGPDAKVSVEIESIRTPGAKGSRINADNDLTGKITITDSSGKTIVKELPADRVAQAYNEEFAKAAGMLKDGKFDVARAKAEMPEGVSVIGPDGREKLIPWEKATREQQLEAFAKKHGQEVTDVYSPEAAKDFNASLNESKVSNVGQLKAGVSTAKLVDPEGLAKMEQYKINSYFNKGGIANQAEAYEQLAKMGKLTKDLTSAYQKLGYQAADLPANMQKALEVVSNRNLSPGARTIELQKLGFDGPGDLAGKLSGRIEGLQKLAGKTEAGGGGSGALNKVVSSIIGSYLKQNDK